MIEHDVIIIIISLKISFHHSQCSDTAISYTAIIKDIHIYIIGVYL